MSSQVEPQTEQDPFDTLLILEDTLYTSAYDLGARDGARAGRIEGRVFGLEKGFEKFTAMGVLHGRACVWGSRLPTTASHAISPSQNWNKKDSDPALGRKKKEEEKEELAKDTEETKVDQSLVENTIPLPSLPKNPRLEKHISTLHGLTDPLTFSTENTEDSVADFDDRFKRGSAKAKIIERIVNEDTTTSDAAGEGEDGSGAARDGEKEVKSPRSPRKGRTGNVKLSGEGRKKGEDSIEDFAGSRFLNG